MAQCAIRLRYDTYRDWFEPLFELASIRLAFIWAPHRRSRCTNGALEKLRNTVSHTLERDWLGTSERECLMSESKRLKRLKVKDTEKKTTTLNYTISTSWCKQPKKAISATEMSWIIVIIITPTCIYSISVILELVDVDWRLLLIETNY